MTSRTTSLRTRRVAAGLFWVVALAGCSPATKAAAPAAPAQHPAAAAAAAPPAPAAKPADALTRYEIPVTASQPAKGSSSALVTIVEWSDLRCTECLVVEPVIDGLMKAYGDQLRVVWRSYMKSGKPDATLAAEFAMEAHSQAGKFWQARELMQQHAQPLTDKDVMDFTAKLGLDAKAVKFALDQHTPAAHLTNDGIFAGIFGVKEIPAFFINGVRLDAPFTPERFKAAIDRELAHAKELVARGVAPENVYAELIKNGVWNYQGASPAMSAP